MQYCITNLRNKKKYKVIKLVIESLYEHANSITRGEPEFLFKKVGWIFFGRQENLNILIF